MEPLSFSVSPEPFVDAERARIVPCHTPKDPYWRSHAGVFCLDTQSARGRENMAISPLRTISMVRA